MKIQFASAAAAAFLLTLTTGCPGGDDSDSGASGSASASDTDGNTSGDSMTSAGPGGETTDGTTVTTTATAGDDPPEPQPDGSDCTTNEECISGKCFYVAVLGGICGECLTDDDCPDGGCSLPIPDLFPTGPKGAVCNEGELGGGCNTTEACSGDLVCSVLIEVPGILTAAGCSECDSDADCDGGQLCSPTYDIGNLSGARMCVDPGSVQNGEGCDHEGTGDDACNSGHCYAYEFMGLVTVGVCGECKTSADCDEGECQEPDLDLDTFEVSPPVCG
jgi:hypothetical protein